MTKISDVEVVYRVGNAIYSIVGEVKVVDAKTIRVTQKGMCSLLRICDLVSLDGKDLEGFTPERQHMEKYKNLGGDSGVVGYEIGLNTITVYFKDGAVYEYDYTTTGALNVEEMKRKATNGIGLNKFINLYVKKKYAKKVRGRVN